MKKIILALAIAAAASMTIVGYASADVSRCEAPVANGITTAMFTALQPKDTTHQFGNAWKHDFTVIVNADNTFSGTSTVTDNGGPVAWTEDVTGKFNADRTLISFDTIPTGAALGGATFKVTDAPYNVSVDVVSTWTANSVEMMISKPVITTDTESVKNHGQYVKSMGGGKEAAQACAGMPTNSTQGKK